MSTKLSIGVVVLALAAPCVLTGCLIGSKQRTHVTGRYVGPDTLAQIQPGKSAEYVTALLGDPSEKVSIDGGVEIWKWSYTERRDSSGSLIFVFSADSQTETQRTTYVELEDDVVVKAWRD